MVQRPAKCSKEEIREKNLLQIVGKRSLDGTRSDDVRGVARETCDDDRAVPAWRLD